MHDPGAVAAEVVARASTLGVRIAAAESLTGGLLAAAIVSVPGASRVFSGAVVAYDTELKASLLGVDAQLLLDRGPVDEAVARQMADGAREACAVAGRGSAGDPGASRHVPADIGVATTGVAGPAPDPQSGQPAGTVWLGISSILGSRAVALACAGEDREAIRMESVRAALELVLAELKALEATQTQSFPGNR